jgi:cell division protease FtsH
VSEFDETALQQEARLLRELLDRFLGTAASEPDGEALVARLEQHLGATPGSFPVVVASWAPHEQADVQLALERWLADHAVPAAVIGTSHPMRRHHSLAELLDIGRHDRGLAVGPPDWVHVPVSPDDTHQCVAFGFYLVDTAPPIVILLRGPDPQVGRESVQLEILAADPDAAGQLVAELRRLAVELSPVRGQIVTLAPPDHPGGSPITFLRRPHLQREGLVLPEPTLEAVERQVLEVAALRDRLRGAGQHLKRGLLLYGPPGTGKTHTVRYLLGRLHGTTAVVLSGTALGLVSAACTLARRHQPSVVVLEDVDLIAGDRSFGPPGSNPLLFEILNQLDGLGDDVDVVFVLTTNRVEVLERALAERPGRVDEAVEVGPPDAAGREQLLRLYGASTGIAELDVTGPVAATEGVTATYLRELVRRAVVTAALARPEAPTVSVRQEDLEAATEELRSSRARLTRALLGAGRGVTEPPGPYQESGWMAYGRPRPGRFRSSPAALEDDDAAGHTPPGWDGDEG